MLTLIYLSCTIFYCTVSNVQIVLNCCPNVPNHLKRGQLYWIHQHRGPQYVPSFDQKRLITYKKQDVRQSTGKQNIQGKQSNSFVSKIPAPKLSCSLLAYVGAVSFIGGTLFAVRDISFGIESAQADNATLMEVKVNPVTPWGIGGSEVTILDESVISPEVGLGETSRDKYIEERPNDTAPRVTEAPISEENTGEIKLYTVEEGDTISEIAENFGISVNTIRWANDLGTKGSIKVGQELVILPITGVQYTVKKGDTLLTIAQKFDGDVDEIIVFNGIEDMSKIAIGDTIIIPDGEAVSTSTTKPTTTQPSQNIEKEPPVKKPTTDTNASYYKHPIPGAKLTQGFHGRWRAHDYGVPVGTPVRASADGTVLVAKGDGWNGGYGNMVIIQHSNGSQTLYAHNSKVLVRVGEKVEQGDIIANSGNSGRSTGPHLHFEIRNGIDIPF